MGGLKGLAKQIRDIIKLGKGDIFVAVSRCSFLALSGNLESQELNQLSSLLRSRM
jgi:hypothetical protein